MAHHILLLSVLACNRGCVRISNDERSEMKKIILITIVSLFLLFAAYGQAFAQWYYGYSVRDAGVIDSGECIINVQEENPNPAGCSNTWTLMYRADKDPKMACAIALGAMMSGKKIHFRVDTVNCEKDYARIIAIRATNY